MWTDIRYATVAVEKQKIEHKLEEGPGFGS
jgi:hypothetical protein